MTDHADHHLYECILVFQIVTVRVELFAHHYTNFHRVLQFKHQVTNIAKYDNLKHRVTLVLSGAVPWNGLSNVLLFTLN